MGGANERATDRTGYSAAHADSERRVRRVTF